MPTSWCSRPARRRAAATAAARASGLPADEALRQAQLELLRGSVPILRDGQTIALRTAEPRHWAPFVLIGPPG